MSLYYVNAEQQKVEAPNDDLAGLVREGRVGADTLVWAEGMEDWRAAAEVDPGLFDLPGGKGPAAASSGEALVPTAIGSRPATDPHPTPAVLPPSAGFGPPASGLAITSLVCGILSIAACGLISAIPGAICGHIALGQIKAAPQLYGGKGLAIAGLATSYVGIAITVIVILVYVVFLFGMFGLAAAGSSGSP